MDSSHFLLCASSRGGIRISIAWSSARGSIDHVANTHTHTHTFQVARSANPGGWRGCCGRVIYGGESACAHALTLRHHTARAHGDWLPSCLTRTAYDGGMDPRLFCCAVLGSSEPGLQQSASSHHPPTHIPLLPLSAFSRSQDIWVCKGELAAVVPSIFDSRFNNTKSGCPH